MQETKFDETLDQILAQDQRYHREAYQFVREALDFTQKQHARESRRKSLHVSGKELLEGIRQFGLSAYGPMTVAVLEEWGVRSCGDFGDIVFNMVEHSLLKKTHEDSRADFAGGYSFFDAFQKPFLPANKISTEASKNRSN